MEVTYAANMAGLLMSQEWLIQGNMETIFWTVETYQGNKLILAKLESGREFFIVFLEYPVTCNIQDL